MTETNRLMTINVRKDFLKRFDEAIQGHYQDRSEAVRDAMRRLMQYLAKVEK